MHLASYVTGVSAYLLRLNGKHQAITVTRSCLQATSLLKKAEGVVTLTVCNPNQSKVAKEEEDRAKGIIPEPEPGD